MSFFRQIALSVSEFLGVADQTEDYKLPEELPAPRIVPPVIDVDDKPETRILLLDTELQEKAPDCTIYFVNNSRSSFHTEPTKWTKRGNDWISLDGIERCSIEVEDGEGNVVAAVGWGNYSYDKHTSNTFGTFVDKRRQGKGIGKALWKAMMRNCGKPKVRGFAVSNKGYTLLKSMAEAFPGVVSFDTDGPLRDLRTTRKTKRINKAKKRAYKKKARAA